MQNANHGYFLSSACIFSIHGVKFRNVGCRVLLVFTSLVGFQYGAVHYSVCQGPTGAVVIQSEGRLSTAGDIARSQFHEPPVIS